MEERIQLNIQLPLEELGRFSRLVDQLQQMMTAAEAGGGSHRETEGSPAFDLARFQELMAREALSREQTSAVKSQADPQPMMGEPGDLSPVPSPAEDLSYIAEIPAARAEVSSLPEAPAAHGEISSLAEAPSAQADLSPLEEAPAAGSELSSLPEISAAQIETALQDASVPTAAPEDHTTVSDEQNLSAVPEEKDLPSPPGNAPLVQEAQDLSVPVAGYYPEVQLPEPPGGSWGGVREELAFPGPSPLTAEAVSLAFQRDDRRYDNGFPLY